MSLYQEPNISFKGWFAIAKAGKAELVVEARGWKRSGGWKPWKKERAWIELARWVIDDEYMRAPTKLTTPEIKFVGSTVRVCVYAGGAFIAEMPFGVSLHPGDKFSVTFTAPDYAALRGLVVAAGEADPC